MFDFEAHKSLEAKSKEAEFFETAPWAAEAILDVELLTPRVLDPCAGRGVLGNAMRRRNYELTEIDLNSWPDAPERITKGVNFLEGTPQEFLCRFPTLKHSSTTGPGFTVVMNPPFSLAVEFVERSFALGARKVVMFQRYAFLESTKRRGFFRDNPPARVWICGDRATCWLGSTPEQDVPCPDTGKVLVKGKKGRSAPTAHAWFVWEKNHPGIMSMGHIWRER